MMLTPADIVDLTNQRYSSDFLLKLRKIYSAENYCLRRLPLVVGKLPKGQLLSLLDAHLPVITARKDYIERIFEELEIKAGGISCLMFKKLIGKAGNIVYHLKSKESYSALELIEVLLEISIYRGHIYNYLHQASENIGKPQITAVITKCLGEEDRFFYELLRIKKTIAPGNGSEPKLSPFQIA
jgi:ferritin-like metal-binding protein YciE